MPIPRPFLLKKRCSRKSRPGEEKRHVSANNVTNALGSNVLSSSQDALNIQTLWEVSLSSPVDASHMVRQYAQ